MFIVSWGFGLVLRKRRKMVLRWSRVRGRLTRVARWDRSGCLVVVRWLGGRRHAGNQSRRCWRRWTQNLFNEENASTRRIAAKVVLLSPVPDDSVVWRGGSMECSNSR